MADKNRKSTQFIPGWPTSHAPKNTTESVKTSSVHEEALDLVQINELQQGQLYIVKIKLIAIALFQGWDDEMCCFSILRTDLLEDLRWSEARYLPENFDAYLAFDYAGNPPIHLWTKHLRAVIPINWFNIFEEARHMQRQWNVSYWDAPAVVESAKPFYSLTDTPVPEEEEEEETETNQDQIIELEDENDEEDVIQEGTVIGTEMVLKETKYYSPQMSRVLPSESPTRSIVPIDTTTTPAMRLQKQYNNKNLVTQSPKNDLNKIEQQQQQQQINEDTVDSVPTIINTNRPEVKQRRSFTSFFLKKKKSKKSIISNDDASSKKEMKRKSAPPTPSIDPKHHFKISETDLNQKFKQEIVKEQMTPELTASGNSSTKNQASSSSSPTVIKTPKNGEVDKLELFDIDSYFDMQATFAFLNNSKQDTFTLLDTKKESIST